ncbi:hypothetical protein MKW92_012743 [Papaver armeniacum]|nr:hypothetical protein MKW92_012743 [Papaver armeniacum]
MSKHILKQMSHELLFNNGIEEFRLRLNVAPVAAPDFTPIAAPIAPEFINFTLHYIVDLISQSKGEHLWILEMK